MPAEIVGSLPADDEIYTKKIVVVTKDPPKPKDTKEKK